MRIKSNKSDRSFPFLPINERDSKPRQRGLTEIRGPYYSVVGRRYLEDLFETMGRYVDSLKFAGGSFTLMPEKAVRELIDLCHQHNVLVSTGGFIERVNSIRRRRRNCRHRIGRGRYARSELVHRSGKAVPRSGRRYHHDRERRDHRKCRAVAN